MRFKPILSLLLLGTVLVHTCKQKGEIDPLAACRDAKLPTPNFKIEEELITTKFETDSIRSDNRVVFTAPEGYKTYEWTIGGSSRVWKTKTFGLMFLDDNVGKYNIRLIASRPKQTECFPNDDGVDTLSKSFTIVPFANAPVVGEYEGKNEGETDVFTVKIAYHAPSEIHHIKNINKGCTVGSSIDTTMGMDITAGAKCFELRSEILDNQFGSDCRVPNGYGNIVEGNKMVITYNYIDITKLPQGTAPYVKIYKKFIGYRK
jgi:hypothetical protein